MMMMKKLSQCRKDPLSLELGEAIKSRVPEVTSRDGGCQGVARYSQHQIPSEPLSCWSRCLDAQRYVKEMQQKVGGWESDSAFDDFFFGSLTVSRIERTQRSGYSRPQARFAQATKRVAWGALETGKLEACGMLFLLYVMVFILEIILLYAGVQLNFAFSLPFQSL